MQAVKECYNRFDTRVSSGLNIEENGFVIKNLTDEDEKDQAYRLRHQVFCKELKWVPETEASLEIDAFDNDAVFLGVLNEYGQLMAFIRIIKPEKRFMLEEVFSFLVSPEHKIRKESDTAELSRLCVIPEARNHITQSNFNTGMISMLLYKGVYQWCWNSGIRYLYFEVDYKFYKLLYKQGITCEMIGPPNIMPDGILATAVILDWRKFEALNSEERPELLRWFSQGQSTPLVRQLRRPEFYLQHQAF
jgi:N-acyl-L-homoserine lactone synthetase